ncbi:MAG: WecB/TagA/CpsF family glycosyltransferase [Chlamydiales bacterium]|nr:WecB/TagA/CpsF family glycosyltransferase [Chlamydiales bacterium]
MTFQLGGLKIQTMTREESLSAVAHQVSPARVYFVNAHCVVVAGENPQYADAVNRAEYVFNDGAGVEAACKILGIPLKDNLNGTDWIPALLDRLAVDTRSYRIFFLGGRPELVAEKSDYFKRWPNLETVGLHHGFYEEDVAVLDKIRKAKPDILLVGMGVPRQELFLDRHWTSLIASGVTLGIAGGAVFDFMSGTVPRAPQWMQKMRMEWMYRLWIEPKRLWRRYLVGVFPFSWIVMKEWFRK